MIFQESKVVKLKDTVTLDIIKEIIAFANSYAGTIFIGVKENGEILGIKN